MCVWCVTYMTALPRWWLYLYQTSHHLHCLTPEVNPTPTHPLTPTATASWQNYLIDKNNNITNSNKVKKILSQTDSFRYYQTSNSQICPNSVLIWPIIGPIWQPWQGCQGGHQMGQIGTKWEKSGTFGIWCQSGPFGEQLWYSWLCSAGMFCCLTFNSNLEFCQ